MLDYSQLMRVSTAHPIPGLFLVAFRSVKRPGDRPRQARDLRVEAERCFRLAQGIASFELAQELEALGREFEAEADELMSGVHFADAV